MALQINLLPLFQRAYDLLAEQGHVMPRTQNEAADFKARIGNDPPRIIVGPECVYVRNRMGHTRPVSILPDEGPEEVLALGQIIASAYVQALRSQSS